MELKYRLKDFLNNELKVLIVPLWNWNLCLSSVYRIEIGFNRTFMELKCGTAILLSADDCVLIVPLWNWNKLLLIWGLICFCFNRTFMELKFSNSEYGLICNWCFNRTFMELELLFALNRDALRAVLIVPLWNWNAIQGLKWTVDTSFNRTFMELKFESAKCKVLGATVLIVPLWNWNCEVITLQRETVAVLIVPLWNWNFVCQLEICVAIEF